MAVTDGGPATVAQDEISVVESPFFEGSPSDLRVGSLVTRLTFVGEPNSERFNVNVLIAEPSPDTIRAGEEEGTYLIPVVSAAKVDLECSYKSSNPLARLLQNLKPTISFAHDSTMLLRNILIDPSNIDVVVDGLLDNDRLRETEGAWQVSTVDFDIFRSIHRQLYLRGGNPEMDVPKPPTRVWSDPEFRADRLSLMNISAMDAYLAMPLPADQ